MRTEAVSTFSKYWLLTKGGGGGKKKKPFDCRRDVKEESASFDNHKEKGKTPRKERGTG